MPFHRYNPEHIRSEKTSEPIERAVSIEGKFLGLELSQFPLWNFSEKAMLEGGYMVGNDALTEVYIETEDGNIYRIFPDRDRRYVLIDARANERMGRNAKAIPLSEEVLEKSVLQVGHRFEYRKGDRTARITKLTAVNGRRMYVEEWLTKYTNSLSSDVRRRFNRILEPDKPMGTPPGARPPSNGREG